MDHTEELLELVGDIYDAALDSSLWSEVVGKIGRFVGGSTAAIFSKSPIDGNGDADYESDTDPHYRRLYFEKYAKLDSAAAGHYFADIGDPIAVEDLMPYREFTETRFYKEWARAQGIVDFVSAVLDESVTSAAIFGVFRDVGDGIVDDEAARRRMRLVVPHIRRAVLVGRGIGLRSAEAAMFANTLDGLSAGICLVDAAGQIVHANAACQAIFAGAEFLSAVDGRLVARDEKIDQTFRKLFATARGGEAAIETEGIAIPLRARDGTRYVAHLLPLTPGARRLAGTAYAATAALFIRKTATVAPSAPEIIARAYNLTPTELRVLLAIVDVGGVPEVAVALGVAQTTVKTHLSRVFVKTGAGRQADLVKIVAGFATPFGG